MTFEIQEIERHFSKICLKETDKKKKKALTQIIAYLRYL